MKTLADIRLLINENNKPSGITTGDFRKPKTLSHTRKGGGTNKYYDDLSGEDKEDYDKEFYKKYDKFKPNEDYQLIDYMTMANRGDFDEKEIRFQYNPESGRSFVPKGWTKEKFREYTANNRKFKKENRNMNNKIKLSELKKIVGQLIKESEDDYIAFYVSGNYSDEQGNYKSPVYNSEIYEFYGKNWDELDNKTKADIKRDYNRSDY